MDHAAALALDEPLARIFRIVLTYQSCLLSIQLYDWILNWKKEYKHIWKQKFTVVSALYVYLRYFEMVRSAITVYLAAAKIPIEDCPPWARWQVYSAMAEAAGIFALFTLRASALYGNSKIVMAFLTLLGSTVIILEGVASPEFGTIPWATGAGACFAGKTPTSSAIVVIFWAGPFVFDVVTTIMLVARVVVIRRRGGSDSSIVRLLARDGLLYFLVISTANLINIGFYLGASEDIQSINSSMAYAVTSVMCSRLVLSLRHHAYKQEVSNNASSHGYTNHKAPTMSGMAKVRGAPGMRSEVGEKNVEDFGKVDQNLHHNIALTTFGSTHRKADEESLEDSQLQPVGGVYVITETKTQVDTHQA